MYGQGNYVPQFGQGPHTPMPPFQQRLPPPPPPPFQQGPPAPQPSIIQQGLPSIPPHVGQHGPPAYQHAPPAPVQQGPPVQVPPSGMVNAGQSYLPPPPPPPPPVQLHGSTSMATAQQNSQWTQNVHHIPPPVPPPLGQLPTGPSRPEMFRLPPPPRVLPPLPSQGQALYRAPGHPPQPGGVQGTQHIPPPLPPPPTSSLFTPTSFGSFVHSAHQNSHMPAMGPPPLPSSPPPPPPPPPPPTSPPPYSGTSSSTALLTPSDLPHYSESHPSSNEHYGFEVMASDSVDKASVPRQIRDDAPVRDGYMNPEGGTSCETGSPMEDGLSSMERAKLEFPPSPPKPADEKIVRKIEFLCQFIAKNGPGFEDMARQKEFGNPEFEFLFGGEPGSEVAVAHEYFVWMKKKCSLAGKLREEREKSASPPRPSEIDSLMQPNDAGVSHSPSDSDMDMEDDITQPDEERRVYNSVEVLNPESVLIPTELDVKEQLHAAAGAQNAAEHSPAKDTISENLPCYGSSGLAEQGKGSVLFPNHDHSTLGQSFSEVDSSVTNLAGAAECPLNDTVVRSSIPPQEDLGRCNASPAAAAVSSEKFSGQFIKGASPFRLLQDYASDDSSENDDEPCLEDVSPLTASPLITAGGTSSHRDMVSNFQADIGLKGHSTSETGFGMFSESVVACLSSPSMPYKVIDFSLESQRTSNETNTISIATGKTEEPVENNHGNQESMDNVSSHEVLQQKDALEGSGGVDDTPKSGKSQKEDVKYTSSLLKVDEFGRLVREGASDSDSDDSHYKGRRVKRGRSRSRSRSPHDRRRRRSPWRRKEKRSRSRSWSPKKRRSRSKSPTFRRGGEFGGDKMRRGKGQLPGCFDFLKGRCYRGASCRYMHHDSDKSDGSRRYRTKHQHVEVPPHSRSSDFHEENENIPLEKFVHEQDEVKSQEKQLFQDMPESRDGSIDGKKALVSVRDTVQPIISDQDSKSLVTDMAESEISREVMAQVQETQDIEKELVEPTTYLQLESVETLQPVDRISARPVTDVDVNAPKSPGDASQGIPSSIENLAIPLSQALLSVPALQNADHQPQQMDGSSASDSSPVQTSTSLTNQLPISEPHPGKISSIQSYPGTGSMSQPFSCESFSSQSLPPKELTPPIFPAVDFPHHPSQLPPPLPSLSQGTNMPLAPQLSGDYNWIPPNAKFPSHSASMENFPSNQAPLPNQHSHFSVSPNSSWTSLPPPPPRPPYINVSTVNAATATPGVPSLHLQQNQLPPRNDFSSQMFVRPYPTELPAYSQVGEFQHRTYPSMQEPHRPPSHMEEFRPKTLPMGNLLSQPFGGPGLVGEDRFTRLPVQGLITPYSFAQGNMPPQPVPFSRESAARRMQSFPGDNQRPGELFTSSSQNHSYLQQQQPLYGLQRPAADSVSVHPGEPGKINSSMSRYTPDHLDRNHPSHLSDFGGSRISNYYNPYASTFDQPLSSKFGSNVLRQEKDTPYSSKYDTPFSLSLVPVDRHGVESLGSRHMTSSPNSARAVEHILPRSGGDQYDPLFDSIEPSSNSFKKFDHGQKREPTNDSDIMLRLSGSHKLLDVEENNKHKEVGAAALSTSLENENDEYGETADAEVGAVENGSPSNPLDVENTATGEIEIDQVKTPGKSKRSKDSRSMKLFKISLADFVKEVLKPSWRQGNMSKEAFKTIVKKTVDKVSGAMKSHQIPKSQAKINQYIDSSQRKLTKLVMGYVDKYVKV